MDNNFSAYNRSHKKHKVLFQQIDYELRQILPTDFITLTGSIKPFKYKIQKIVVVSMNEGRFGLGSSRGTQQDKKKNIKNKKTAAYAQ